MNKDQITKGTKELFKSYPTVNEFHATSDGQAFELKENAEAHARQLDKDNPEVITVKRDGKISQEDTGAEVKAVKTKDAEKAPVVKTETVKTATEPATEPAKEPATEPVTAPKATAPKKAAAPKKSAPKKAAAAK